MLQQFNNSQQKKEVPALLEEKRKWAIAISVHSLLSMRRTALCKDLQPYWTHRQAGMGSWAELIHMHLLQKPPVSFISITLILKFSSSISVTSLQNLCQRCHILPPPRSLSHKHSEIKIQGLPCLPPWETFRRLL